MKHLIRISAVAAVFVTGNAMAADLPARGMAPAPVYAAPLFTWAGFYVGLNAGYGFAANQNAITTGLAPANVLNVNGGARPAVVSLRPDGFIGGGQIGYNMQSGAFVYGVEADINYTRFRDQTTVITPPLAGPGQLANTFNQRLNYLGTVRGRIGYAFDRTLVYATGGLAYGEINNSVNLFGTAGQLQFTGSERRTKAGYALGVGVEQSFSPMLSAKLEYMYYDLGRSNVNSLVVPGSGGGGIGYSTRFRNNGHLIRVGLNYRFGSTMGAPVLARY